MSKRKRDFLFLLVGLIIGLLAEAWLAPVHWIKIF
jgi:hypothetical protein